MKKSILASSIAFALCVSATASAGILGNSKQYDVTVNKVGSCFAFGDCILLGAGGENISGGSFTITTDAAGDGFSVGSYNINAYTGTPGGLFTTGGVVAGAGTNVGNALDLNFAGRTGSAAFFPGLGTPPWNVDDNTKTGFTSGVYEGFTTGTDTNLNTDGLGAIVNTLTGSALIDNGDTTFSAVIVSVGNVGASWGAFDATPYTEVYNITLAEHFDSPVVIDETFSVKETQSIDILIETILRDAVPSADGGEVTFVSVAATTAQDPASTITDNNDGSLTYNSGTVVVGLAADSFEYIVTDDNGAQTTGTIIINVVNVNPPVANSDDVFVDEDSSVTFDPVDGLDAGILVDTDVQAGQTPLVLVRTDSTTVNKGIISSVGNDVTYTPFPDFNGIDTFQYTIQNVGGARADATVTVTVAPINDKPICEGLVSLTTPIGESLDITNEDLVSTTSDPALCIDVDGDALTVATFDTSSAQDGTVSSDGAIPQLITYTPPSATFEGNDTFSFTATDGILNADPNIANIQVADPNLGNFTMLNVAGSTFGGTNDVIFEWDGTSLNVDDKDTTVNATMRSQIPHPFFGSPWFAHHIRMFGPGTYTFDTTCNKADMDAGITVCNRPFTNPEQTQQFLTVTVGPGQIGGLVFFDYTVTENIDVFMVWDRNMPWNTLEASAPKNALFTGAAGLPPDPTTDWELVSTDGDGDGIVGVAMIDGSFIGFSANFNIGPGGTAEALPPITSTAPDTALGGSSLSIWGILGSLFTLFGFRRFQNRHSTRS